MMNLTVIGLIVWASLVLGSAAIGIACALLFRELRALVLGAAVPWFGLLGVLLYWETFVPYSGGGASMWPIAQLFGGTIAALSGLVAAAVTQQVRARRARHRLEDTT
jgi:hypothetical protein